MPPPPAFILKGAASIAGRLVFSQIELHMPIGKWTCLLGASGVGKSTVVNLLAGLGEHIDFQGKISTRKGEPLPDVTMMAQDDLLLPWLNVIDNVMIGARLRGEAPNPDKARDVLARVGLSEHGGKYPPALSGGQRQRVALARTLMEERPLVLLDEPFSGLDAMTRMQMQDLTAQVLQDKTVLLVTHDPAEAARMGEQILILSQNKVTHFPAPTGDIPRKVDARDVLEHQARLLKMLRNIGN